MSQRLEILNKIDQKKRALKKFHPLPAALQKNLNEWFKVELTYTSNAIEGNTLSRQETSLIIEKGITVAGKTVREHLEAIQHAEALEFIHAIRNKKPITEKSILEIHQIILKKIDDVHAGRYRNVSVRVSGSTVIFPNPLKIPTLMQQLATWLKEKKKAHVVKVAADAHFKLVTIHPFTDGNGRTARLLMNLLLTQNGFPPAVIRKEDRLKYIQSIEKGQLHGKLEDYYAIIFEAVEHSLDLYLEALAPQEKKEGTTKKLLKIGELAKATHESVPTLRFWTQEKLLKVAAHTKKGYQLYDPETIDTVRRIRTLQHEERQTLQEIKELLSS